MHSFAPLSILKFLVAKKSATKSATVVDFYNILQNSVNVDAFLLNDDQHFSGFSPNAFFYLFDISRFFRSG